MNFGHLLSCDTIVAFGHLSPLGHTLTSQWKKDKEIINLILLPSGRRIRKSFGINF